MNDGRDGGNEKSGRNKREEPCQKPEKTGGTVRRRRLF